MPPSSLNSLGLLKATAIAAWGSVSMEADGRCLCCSVVGNALGKCQFVVDSRNVDWCSFCENCMEGPQKIKNRTSIWFWNSTFVYISEENEYSNSKNIHIPIFIAELFTIAKIRKQPKHPSMDEWINKLWFIPTTDYFSAIRHKCC